MMNWVGPDSHLRACSSWASATTRRLEKSSGVSTPAATPTNLWKIGLNDRFFISMAAVSVSVGGLWRTSVDVTARTTWWQLKQLIRDKTAVPISNQRLTPSGKLVSAACGLGEGDEVMCEWKKDDGAHPLHFAGEDPPPPNAPSTAHGPVFLSAVVQDSLPVGGSTTPCSDEKRRLVV